MSPSSPRRRGRGAWPRPEASDPVFCVVSARCTFLSKSQEAAAVPSARDCAFTAPDTHTPAPSGSVSLTQFGEENSLPGAQRGVRVARARGGV